MSRISVIIVDDESLARQIVREYLLRDERFEIVAECDGGRAALEAIHALKPDVVLLDIQMPEVDGFDVLSQLEEPYPATIMVTAFNEHALRAFDFHALDYVLKPIEEERLHIALDRAARRIEESRRGRAAKGMEELIGSLRAESPQHDRIVLKSSRSILFLEPDELLWIEAAGNYLKVEAGGKQHLVRGSISGLMTRLDPEAFLRIHRSFIVNRSLVIETKVLPGGSDYAVVLRGGRELPVGRSFRKEVLAKLGLSS